MSKFRLALLSTAAVGLTVTAMTGVQAGEVEKSMSVNGHVARMIGTVNNGDGSSIQQDASDRSGSRIYVKGSAKSESMTIGATMQFRPDGKGNVNPTTNNGPGISTAQSYLYVKNSMGTLTLGDTTQVGGDTSQNSSSLSGAQGLGSDNNGAPFGGGVFMATNATNNEENATAGVNGARSFTFDSDTGLRYDSPSFNGFNFALGIAGGSAEGGAAESAAVSIKYAADYDGTAVKVHYLYAATAGDSATIESVQNAGIGVELAAGINATVGWGDMSMKSDGASSTMDPTAWYGEIGYDTKAFSSMGETSIMVSYSNQDEARADTGDYTGWGLNLEQNLDDYGTTVFGGVARQEYSITGTNYDDVTTTWLGLKVTF